ncbi:hypothetical protein [Stigmatella aurantiaca]|uniref:hypothetical protein n=1 Tax=Stigmatella aurantiaca TaxID=41 RepID=UPI0002FE3FE2|nr:hypothetical protein [Stigmatella aurantiaca]
MEARVLFCLFGGKVLGLRDSSVDLSALKMQFDAWPMPNLKEVLVISPEGTIVPFWP